VKTCNVQSFNPLAEADFSSAREAWITTRAGTRWAGARRAACTRRRFVSLVEEIAAEKRVTAAQVALAWVLHQNPRLVTIPGTRKVTRLKENLAAMTVRFSDEELARIREGLPDETAGTRCRARAIGVDRRRGLPYPHRWVWRVGEGPASSMASRVSGTSRRCFRMLFPTRFNEPEIRLE